jgi:hypothetical protein
MHDQAIDRARRVIRNSIREHLELEHGIDIVVSESARSLVTRYTDPMTGGRVTFIVQMLAINDEFPTDQMAGMMVTGSPPDQARGLHPVGPPQ